MKWLYSQISVSACIHCIHGTLRPIVIDCRTLDDAALINIYSSNYAYYRGSRHISVYYTKLMAVLIECLANDEFAQRCFLASYILKASYR